MTPAAAIGLCVAIFTAGWLHLCRKDIFFAGVFLWLFIYSIFTQYGYAFMPDLSTALRLYFGPEVFLEYALFVSASLAGIYLLSLPAIRFIRRTAHYHVRPVPIPGGSFPLYAVLVTHLLILGLIFARNYSRLEYSNSSDEFFLSSLGLEFVIFGILFKLQVVFCVVEYAVLRWPRECAPFSNKPLWVIFFASLLLFGIISNKVGSRTDPLALLLGISVIELEIGVRTRTMIRRFIFIGVVGLLGLTALSFIARQRSMADENYDWRTMVIANDYYIPSHMLLGAIAFEYVDPLQVARSNGGNALIKMNQPYLQAAVTDHFSPGLTTRNASYAFYVLTEGYIFAGKYFGVLYNALVLVFWLTIWRLLAASSNGTFNLAMLGVISSQFANIARGQTSYFFKDLYLLFAPAAIVLILATKLVPQLRPYRRRL